MILSFTRGWLGGSLIPDTWTPETFQSQVPTDQLEDGSRPQVLDIQMGLVWIVPKTLLRPSRTEFLEHVARFSPTIFTHITQCFTAPSAP